MVATLFKLLSVVLIAIFVRACDRTCDILYFANYDDLSAGTTLDAPRPYLGLLYNVYKVYDFTGNRYLSVPSGPNAIVAVDPKIPTNRATITVNRPEIMILDPESAFMACVSIDKASKKIKGVIGCEVQVTGTGPNYYIVSDVWSFKPDSKQHSAMHLYNLGDKFNNITTLELKLLSNAQLGPTKVPGIVLDEFVYGGRLSN